MPIDPYYKVHWAGRVLSVLASLGTAGLLLSSRTTGSPHRLLGWLGTLSALLAHDATPAPRVSVIPIPLAARSTISFPLSRPEWKN